MTILSRVEVLVLAKEVLAGKARSYVSAAHALAEYLVDTEAEKRVTLGDAPTPAHRQPTLPLPFVDPSPPDDACPLAEGFASSRGDSLPPDSDEVMPWDAAAKRILDLEPKTHPRLVREPTEPATGVREMLPPTKVGGGLAPCAAHDVRECVICKRGPAA